MHIKFCAGRNSVINYADDVEMLTTLGIVFVGYIMHIKTSQQGCIESILQIFFIYNFG